MKFFKHTLVVFVLIAGILACNFPSREQVLPPSEAQTVAALTVQALLTTPEPSATEPQAVIAVTASHTPTVTAANTATITPTFSTPMLTIKEQTNCRTGPGQDYEIVFTYLPNKKLTILGRYDPGNFWLVKSDESPTGQCWLWGEYTEVSGSYWAVSSVTPPPTHTKAPPLAPSIDVWNFSCSAGTLTFEVKWNDRSENETGYKVFRNGEAVIDLPPNSTSYVETIAVTAGEKMEYYIHVYSPYGTADSPPMKMFCN